MPDTACNDAQPLTAPMVSQGLGLRAVGQPRDIDKHRLFGDHQRAARFFLCDFWP